MPPSRTFLMDRVLHFEGPPSEWSRIHQYSRVSELVQEPEQFTLRQLRKRWTKEGSKIPGVKVSTHSVNFILKIDLRLFPVSKCFSDQAAAPSSCFDYLGISLSQLTLRLDPVRHTTLLQSHDLNELINTLRIVIENFLAAKCHYDPTQLSLQALRSQIFTSQAPDRDHQKEQIFANKKRPRGYSDDSDFGGGLTNKRHANRCRVSNTRTPPTFLPLPELSSPARIVLDLILQI